MNFAEGTLWSEGGAGTNAIGTALALDHAVQVFGPDQFSDPVQRWTCSAATAPTGWTSTSPLAEALGWDDFGNDDFEEIMSTHYGRMVVLDDRVLLFANPEDAAEYIGFDLQPVQ
jgi:hypothetical protein